MNQRSNTPGPKREARRNAADRVLEFVHAASALFAEKGFDRTTVRDIADAIGLASGSMFYHFKNKDDLLEAVIRQGMLDGLAVMHEALRIEHPPLARFRAIVIAHLEALHGELGHVHQVSVREWRRLGPEARARLHKLNEEYRDIWLAALQELKQGGYLRSDSELTRRTMVAGLNWSVVWHRGAGSRELARLGEELCAVALNMPVTEFRTLLAQEGRGRKRPAAGG